MYRRCLRAIRWFLGLTDSLCLAAVLSSRGPDCGTASRLMDSMVPAGGRTRLDRGDFTGVPCALDCCGGITCFHILRQQSVLVLDRKGTDIVFNSNTSPPSFTMQTLNKFCCTTLIPQTEEVDGDERGYRSVSGQETLSGRGVLVGGGS